MTTTAKPKAKFSSRNLSAVFKAPLRSKPLPDHAAGPLQRPNSRMLVLGRAAATPPAPINTPSLKRESQVHDAHVSLVPAGSNWAENADKQQTPEENEASESAPTSAEVEAPTAMSEKVWTPESVAEHLHTASAAARPKVAAENSGRWGDDAVEHDIFRNHVRRQMQKEREFPGLKEAVEDAQMHHGQGHTSAADRSPPMGPQQAEQHQHHGRATGRWAHFGEQEEMHRPLQGDRWSRDRYGEDDRWSRDRDGRDDGERWSRDRYSRDGDDRCSRSRYDDGSGRERRPYESDNSAISPASNDSHTHFSRSDARFDMVASGDRDRVWSHSPHRMDWSSGRLRQSERSSSLAPVHGPEGSRFHSPPPHRSLTQSPASVSPSSSPTTPPLAADTTPARAMNWRNLTSADRDPDRAWRTQHRTDEPSTFVAETAKSNTDSSSNSCASSSPIPSQQVQLLKRPKMLFDPKTGGMVSAEDKASPSVAKRQSSRSGGGNREDANTPAIQLQSTAKPSNTRKPEAEAASAKSNDGEKPGHEEEKPVAVIAANTVQEISSETSSSISSDAVLAEQVAGSAKKERARATAKQPARHQPAPRATKSKRDPRSKQSTTSQTQQRPNPPNSTADTRTEHGKRAATSTRNGRRPAGGNTPSSGHTVQLTSGQKVAPTEVALLKQIAEGGNGNIVRVTDEQEGIEVSQEDDGFETVKSRRVVLSEKKKRRQRLASGEAAARASEFVDENKKAHAPVSEERGAEQSKGEEAQEIFGRPSKQVDTQPSSKPRGKAGKDRKQKQTKQSRPRAKEYKQKVQPVVKPTQSEQVAGEAPAESPLPKKKSQSAKAMTETKRELKPRKQSTVHPSRKPSDRKETADAAERKKETGKRQSTERASGDAAGSTARTVEKVPAAKVSKPRPKQVRKVYVVKTPAPAAAPNATSTA